MRGGFSYQATGSRYWCQRWCEAYFILGDKCNYYRLSCCYPTGCCCCTMLIQHQWTHQIDNISKIYDEMMYRKILSVFRSVAMETVWEPQQWVLSWQRCQDELPWRLLGTNWGRGEGDVCCLTQVVLMEDKWVRHNWYTLYWSEWNTGCKYKYVARWSTSGCVCALVKETHRTNGSFDVKPWNLLIFIKLTLQT